MRLYAAGLLLAAAFFSTLFFLLFPHTSYPLPWLISGFLLFSSILFLSGSILPVLPVKHPAFEILVKNEKLLLLLIKSNGKKVSYISPQALPYFSQYRNDWLGGFCSTEKDSLKQDFAHAAAGKKPDQGEYRLKTETGKELWLSIRMYGIRRWNCTRLVAVVCRDVSVSRESQLQLVEAREYEIEVGAEFSSHCCWGNRSPTVPALRLVLLPCRRRKLTATLWISTASPRADTPTLFWEMLWVREFRQR